MKRLFCILGLVFGLVAAAQTPQQTYIDTYSPIAVEEMLRSGVPASITLAQGLLESGAGQSRLATQGNNHFGIKCHKGWTGASLRHDDDQKNECFRSYDSPEESFRDHSDFLRYRDRYKFLFDLERTDYKGWAYGLKKAGYATDPGYPGKLIKYIEEYDLTRFDEMTDAQQALLPEPPHKIEEPVLEQPSARESDAGENAPVAEEFQFALSRQMYSLNGVPFVYSMDGETYGSIARNYHLFKKEILKYNDLQFERDLAPGTIVYLAAKKRQTPKGLDLYIVEEDGESFHDICQRFAVKESAVRKLNGFGKGDVVLREDQEIKLR